MVMNLPPFSINPPEDPARPDRHSQHFFTRSVLSPLSTHNIEDLSSISYSLSFRLSRELGPTVLDVGPELSLA